LAGDLVVVDQRAVSENARAHGFLRESDVDEGEAG
jgi:hypothetical protein